MHSSSHGDSHHDDHHKDLDDELYESEYASIEVDVEEASRLMKFISSGNHLCLRFENNTRSSILVDDESARPWTLNICKRSPSGERSTPIIRCVNTNDFSLGDKLVMTTNPDSSCQGGLELVGICKDQWTSLALLDGHS